MTRTPSYDGNGLVNLVAAVEVALTGSAPSPGLADVDIGAASSIVLVLFDGLGVAQLGHPGAAGMARSLAGTISSPFPSTTTVSLTTIATGLTPGEHGQVGHLSWMPDLGIVVNTLKWVTLTGEPVPYEYPTLLPAPNLWERLRTAGIEPITVQPGDFQGSPLSRALYRGARFESAWDTRDLIDATVQLAGTPGRFIFTYVNHVDFAGHVFGQESVEFAEAMRVAAAVWEGIAAGLPAGVILIGTADHGLLEFSEEQKVLVRDTRFDELRMAGDTRGVQLWGDSGLMEDLAAETGGQLVDPLPLLGPLVGQVASSRIGERVLLAPDDRVIIPRGFDKRLRCYHGGLTDAELRIPLLLG